MALTEQHNGIAQSGASVCQQVMITEYDQSVQRLSTFVNQEISRFKQCLTLFEGTPSQIQNTETEIHEVPQAMTERVDKVEPQIESISLFKKKKLKRW